MTKRGSWLMGAVLAGLAVCAAPAQAGPNLVVNGGFETGDFTGWTQTGNTSFNGVFCPTPAFEGNCEAFFGPVGSVGGISQTVNVGAAGLPIHVLFWVNFDGGTPSSFDATVNGVHLDAFPLTNPAAGATLYHFGFISDSASETLAFSFRDDPGFILFDAVELRIPEPATVALLGAALAGLGFSRRRKTA